MLNKLLCFVGGLSLNDFLGWGFIGFSAASALGVGIPEPELTQAICWCILAKLCWIHADIKAT